MRRGKLRLWGKFVHEMDLKWNSRGGPTSINNTCMGSVKLLSSAFHSEVGRYVSATVVYVPTFLSIHAHYSSHFLPSPCGGALKQISVSHGTTNHTSL